LQEKIDEFEKGVNSYDKQAYDRKFEELEKRMELEKSK